MSQRFWPPNPPGPPAPQPAPAGPARLASRPNPGAHNLVLSPMVVPGYRFWSGSLLSHAGVQRPAPDLVVVTVALRTKAAVTVECDGRAKLVTARQVNPALPGGLTFAQPWAGAFIAMWDYHLVVQPKGFWAFRAAGQLIGMGERTS